MNNNYQQFLNQTGGPTAPAQPQGNFLERLLPTAGGILGGIGGALIPGLGETGVGEIGGASLGSALGQKLQNSLTGSKNSTLGAGAEGALGQLTGMGIGKAVGGVLGGIGKATAPAIETAEQTNAKQLNNYLSSFDPLTKYQTGVDTRINNKILTTGKTMQDLGVNGTPEAFQQAGDIITKHIDPRLKSALGTDALPVDDQARKVINQAVLNGDISPEAGVRKNLANEQEAVDPQQLFGQIKALEQEARGPLRTNTQLTYDQSKALDAKATTAASLRDVLFKQSGVNERISSMKLSPQEEAQIMADTQDHPGVGKYIIDNINNSKTAPQLRSAMAPGVRADKLGTELLRAREGRMALQPGEEAPHILEDPVQAALHLATAGPVGKVGAAAKLMGGIVPVVNKGANLLDKLPFRGAAKGAGQVAAHLPSIGSSPTPEIAPTNITTGNTGANMDFSPLQNAQQNETGTVSPQEFRQAAVFAPQLLPVLQKAQQASVAQQALGGLQESFAGAGGGQGMGSGFLSRLSGLIPGTAAYQYEQQKLAVANAIAQATGQHPESVLAMLPSLMQGGGAGAEQFGTLGGELGTLGQAGQVGVPTSVLGQIPPMSLSASF